MANSFKTRLLLLMVISLAAFQCDPEIIVPPPINLTSQYTGTYARQVEGTDSSVVVPIIWQFNSNEFSMALDRGNYASKDSASIPEPFLLCNWQGEYKIDAGIELMRPSPNPQDSSRTVRTCGGPYAPYGAFTLEQSVTGEITMTSLTEDPHGKSIVRTIHLVRRE